MLKNERISLSSLKQEDTEKLFQWINDPELVRLNAPYKPIHWENHIEWFKEIAQERNRTIFGIRENSQNILIGVIQLINIDPIHRNAELIIRIGDERFRGKGFGKEALLLMLDYAWRDLNLHRVWLKVYSSNLRAIAAYRAINFIEEGRLRQSAYINGVWEDVVIMGILRTGEIY